MVASSLEDVDISVVFADGFRAWNDRRLMSGADFGSEFQSISQLVKAVLRGYLPNSHDLVDKTSTLRVLERIKDLGGYCTLQKEAMNVLQESNGRMTTTVMEYVRGSFLEGFKAITKDINWSVGTRMCDETFVKMVSEFHGLHNAVTNWLESAVSTPCVCVNNKTGHSHSSRAQSSFDGSAPDRICKSDVNIYDLFLAVACNGDLLILKQKNCCAVSLVPHVLSGDSKVYVFEISGMFERYDLSPPYAPLYSFFYFRNGLVLDIHRGFFRAVDSQYRFSENINAIHAAIACRFRVPYTFVADFIEGQRAQHGSLAMTGDHCDIDSGNTSVLNLRFCSPKDQNNSKNGDQFVFSVLKKMKMEDALIIKDAFNKAIREKIPIVPLFYISEKKEDEILIDGDSYRKMQTIKGLYYFKMDGDTILLKSSDECNIFSTQIKNVDRCKIEFLSMRVYVTRGLCDVSDCAAQVRYTKIQIGDVKFSVSRSIAYSDAFYCREMYTYVQIKSVGDGLYAPIKIQGELLHVHHKNAQPRHNFSENLEIITQSANNQHAQEASIEKGQNSKSAGFVLSISQQGEFSWGNIRHKTKSVPVESLEEAQYILAKSSQDSYSISILFSKLFSKKAAEVNANIQTYRFKIFDPFDSSNNMEGTWTIGELLRRCEMLRIRIDKSALDKLVRPVDQKRGRGGMPMNGKYIQIQYLGGHGKILSSILKRKDQMVR